LLFLQVRCVDKGTGDMLVRYTMAAQGALVVLRQLLAACRVEPGQGEHCSRPLALAVQLQWCTYEHQITEADM
jgi:hypothetical protein